jgi:pimeloyl-ACP methyl ester carboxylesterase
LADEADQAAAHGHRVGARETYLRASLYYALSYHPIFGAPVDPRLLTAFRKQSAVFAKAAALADPPGEAVAIPYGDTTLPGYFFPADDTLIPGPLLIATNGYDATLFEMYLGQGLPAHQRGYHCLLFDGPGQGQTLFEDGIPMRPDWENVVAPVVDLALQRPEVDPERIALTGWSLGGYLALRAVTGEHRVTACIADPALLGIVEGMKARMQAMGTPSALVDRLPDLDDATRTAMANGIQHNRMQRWTFERRGYWVHGVNTLEDYIHTAAQFTLAGRIEQIQCPVLLCAAQDDPLSGTAATIYNQLSASKTLLQFTRSDGASGHCEMGNRSLFNLRAFNWLAETSHKQRQQIEALR